LEIFVIATTILVAMVVRKLLAKTSVMEWVDRKEDEVSTDMFEIAESKSLLKVEKLQKIKRLK